MAEKKLRPGHAPMPNGPGLPPVQSVEDETPQNAYYARVSRAYRAAKYVAVLLLVLVLLAGMFTGADSITYANFVYLLRDFDTVLNASGGEAAVSVRYGRAEERAYLLYRDNLVLVGQSGLNIYNTGGKLTLEEDHGLETPCAVSSDRYLMLYDLGGKTYSLYNSLTRIHTETLGYPISGGAISDSGLYAVVTKTREYTSAVLLYGKNAKLKNRYLKDKYVLDVAISNDGERVAILSVESVDGAYRTEFQLCRPGADEAVATLTLSGVFPLSVGFFDDNTAILLCDDALRFYRADGELISSFAFSDVSPARFVCGGRYAALAFAADAAGQESRVMLFDAAGSPYFAHTVAGKAQDVALYEDTVYLLTDRSLLRLTQSTVEAAAYAGGGKAVLADHEGVLLCTASAAYRYTSGRFSDTPAAQE